MPISTGTIYRIICLPEPSIQYIGSTFNQLKQRWSTHKNHYRINDKKHYISIYPYFDKYGIENFKLVKIKDYQVWREHKKDNKHLRIYEQLWINKIKCINTNNAFGIKRITSKSYEIKNKDKRKEYRSRPENKQRKKETSRIYEIKNKDKRTKKTNCICGSIYIKRKQVRHEQSQKHIKYVQSLN